MIRKFRVTGYEPAVEQVTSLLDGVELGKMTILTPQTRVVKIMFESDQATGKQIYNQPYVIRYTFENMGWTDVLVSEIFD